MTKKFPKKVLSIILSIAMLIGCVSAIGISAFASDYEDNLKSGTYEITADSYADGISGMKLEATIKIDTETNTFSTQRNGAEKGTGTISFDASTGVYTVAYTEYAPAGAVTTFTYDNDVITFTAPIYFGTVKLNTTFEDGTFAPYTAKLQKTYEDNLKSGTYEITADSYADGISGMKLEATIKIDTETNTFSTQRNGAEKGTGTISFDASTGVYTVAYIEYAPAGAVTTFTYDNDVITFTAPIYFGTVKLNTTFEDGTFAPYTAKLQKTYEDNLKSGTYEITADSYADGISGMKLEATIKIDTETNTFSTQRNGAEKGTGTISFDASTGVYTVAYTEYAPAGAVTTFTYDNDVITFTAPIYFGTVKLNTTFEDGTFAPYTAKLAADADIDDGDDNNGDVTNPSQAAFKEGTYTGVYEKAAMGSTLRYNITAAFADGKYSYDVNFEMGGEVYEDDTETGTYTIDGSTLTFDGGNLTSAVITDEGKLTITGVLSSFAFGATASADIVWTSADKPSEGTEEENPVTYSITEGAAGEYVLGTAKDYTIVCDGAFADFVDVTVDGVQLDTKNYTVSEAPTKVVLAGSYLETLAIGSYKVVLNYTNGSSEAAVITVIDENVTFADALVSGQYQLTEDSYDSSAMMKIPAIITIDTEKKTFSITDGREATFGEAKGSGTYVFNANTGVYTMTYTADVADTRLGSTTTFVCDDNSITFTSPLVFGSAAMNITDEDGNFIPYTAKLVVNGEFAPSSTSSNYMFIEGADGTVAQGVAESYTLRVNGALDKFVAIYVDGEVLDASNYETSTPYTTIVLSADYMKSLEAGEHTIKVVYSDGKSVETTLNVRSVFADANADGNTVADSSNATTGTGSAKSPNTGNAGILVAVLAVAMASAAAVTVFSRKKAMSK